MQVNTAPWHENVRMKFVANVKLLRWIETKVFV